MTKVYVVDFDNADEVREMFHDFGCDVLSDLQLDEAELAVFCGGADVSPHLYGEENTGESHCDPARDAVEKVFWSYFKSELGIPCVGICRGGQFLNVMNGGKLIQHIEGHNMGFQQVWRPSEYTKPDDGQNLKRDYMAVELHEDHHQAIVPCAPSDYDLTFETGVEVLGIASDGVVEVCWYPWTEDLCYQPHPEWNDEPTCNHFLGLLREKGLIDVPVNHELRPVGVSVAANSPMG